MSTTANILSRILARKAEEVAQLRAMETEKELRRRAQDAPEPRSLRQALCRQPGGPIKFLAEIKRASPSAGAIRMDLPVATVARDYEAGGAAGISVLTDRDFFAGELSFLAGVRMAVEVPLLRKDFLIATEQVIEARAAGADAVLLIAAALPYQGGPGLAEMLRLATELGMDALVEVHDGTELDRALDAGATLVGVNHRNLSTFAIDMELTARLAPRVPAGVVLVAESGIRAAEDVARLSKAGAHAVLVGEHLMRAPQPGAALAALRAGASG